MINAMIIEIISLVLPDERLEKCFNIQNTK